MDTESISDEAAKDIHAEAHPECEGCRSTLCLWQSGCACCPPSAVVVEGLPFCSQACADEVAAVPVEVEEPETTPIPVERMAAVVAGGGRERRG